MTKFTTKSVAAAAAMAIAGMTGTAQATDSVNVAFFLEWATPNQIAKVDKAYDDAMGVDVNWTDFSTGVQMTEAMLAGDIDIQCRHLLAEREVRHGVQRHGNSLALELGSVGRADAKRVGDEAVIRLVDDGDTDHLQRCALLDGGHERCQRTCAE